MNNLEMTKAGTQTREVIMLPLQRVMSSLILFFAAGYAWPAEDDAAFKAFPATLSNRAET